MKSQVSSKKVSQGMKAHTMSPISTLVGDSEHGEDKMEKQFNSPNSNLAKKLSMSLESQSESKPLINICSLGTSDAVEEPTNT